MKGDKHLQEIIRARDRTISEMERTIEALETYIKILEDRKR